MAAPSIKCPICHRVSFNPKDIAERYCGACHFFHSDIVAQPRNLFAAKVCDVMQEGFRQCGDTTITGLAWNLISLIPEREWLNYGQLVVEAHSKGLDWLEAAKQSVKQYRKHSYTGFWRMNFIESKAESDAVYWQRCLYLTLEKFSDRDWQQVMTSFTEVPDALVPIPQS